MLLTRGSIVCSVSGRDSGCFMVVVSVEEGYAYVCDGKQRPIDRPKRKNLKHLRATSFSVSEEQMLTNKTVRHALNILKQPAQKERFECPKRI